MINNILFFINFIVFFCHSKTAENQFDFISFEANLERMIREAEFQNADIVAGAWVDENGHWSTSCLQLGSKIRNCEE